jgi:hypothetical protein
MSKFVVRNKKNNTYYTGTASSWTRRFVDTIDKARVYGRKCDATNSIVGVFPRNIDTTGYRARYLPVALQGIAQHDLEVVPVTLSIAEDSSTPSIKISAEVLDRATRFMMTDEARQAGAPSSLVDSFDDLETDEIVKLVTALYGNK